MSHCHIQLSQLLPVDGMIDPARILLVALALHQADVVQDVQVVRDQAERKAQSLGDLAVALDALHQHVENAET